MTANLSHISTIDTSVFEFHSMSFNSAIVFLSCRGSSPSATLGDPFIVLCNLFIIFYIIFG